VEDLLELVAGCCRGEETAWDAFLPKFQAIGRRALRTFLLSEADFDEVLSRALFSIYQGGLRQFRGGSVGQLVSFLGQIVRNEGFDFVRGKGTRAVPESSGGANEGERSSDADALTALVEEECEQFLRQEVERLKRDEKELFLMKARGLKEREIAEQTGRPRGTVAAQIARLLERLRQRLRERGCLD
jgi:RNA polymerase sigma factor (sigma-70 family)